MPAVESSAIKRVKLSDTGMWTNQNLSFARATRDMIMLAEAILKGALLRNESRGAHYKPAFPDRNDEEFLKATIATYDAASNSSNIPMARWIRAWWFRGIAHTGKKRLSRPMRQRPPRRRRRCEHHAATAALALVHVADCAHSRRRHRAAIS